MSSKNSDCPPDEALRNVLEQTLEGDLLSEFEQHLAHCIRCQDRMDDLTDAADIVIGQADLSFIPDVIVSKLRETPQQHKITTAPDGDLTEASEVPPSVIGDFDIADHIASGGTGALYRATDRRLGRSVALKVLHSSIASSESARQRVLREARALAAIKHPNVVSVFSVGEDEQQRPYIAMELIDGETLAQHVESQGAFLPQKAAILVEQSACGLAAAHSHGLIHRDIKSSNILMDQQSQSARVVDFGLVRDDEQQTQLTREGVLAGTPAYMSPEQIIDPISVDARTDVYSLGIVLYELLTGVVPFRGVVRMALQQVQFSEPQPPRELNDAIPDDLQTICLKAMEKTPERRYQSAEELADDLQRFLKNETILARPVGQVEKARRWCQRNPRLALLSGLVAFAMTSAFGVTAASAYRISVAGQEVREADGAARRNADALIAQRDAAMETVSRLVFDVPPLLQELMDDTSEVEKSILKIALDGLDKVAQSAEDSGEIDYNTAHALQQLGMALYMADELDEAESQLQRGLRLAEQMRLRGEPLEVTVPLVVAIHSSLASIDWDLQQPDAEQQHYSQAILAAREWYDQSPSAESTLLLGSSLNLLADSEVSSGNVDAAKRNYESSAEILKSAELDPTISMELNICLEGLASLDAGLQSPEIDRLKRELQADVRASQDHAEQFPDDTAAERRLFDALLSMAAWHAAFGNPGRAESLCNNASEMVLDSHQFTAFDKAVIQRHRADAFLAGDVSFGRTRKAYQRALEQFESLPADSPRDAVFLEQILLCQIGIGSVFTDQGNGVKARPYLEKALVQLKANPLLPNAERHNIDATLGLAWVAYYDEDNEQAEKLLDSVLAQLLQIETTVDAEEQGGDPFMASWLENSRFDIEDLKAALADE